MSSQALISLAILKANWDTNRRDYVDNFTPLLAECIRLSPDEVVSATDLHTSLFARFGLRLPTHVLQRFLKRLQRRGLVRDSRGALVRNTAELEKLPFHQLQQRALEMHEALTRRLIEFCRNNYGIPWAPSDAENALHAYLDQNHLVVVQAALNASLLPPSGEPPKSASFLVAAFARELQEQHAAEFEYLVQIVAGNMLANAVFLPDPSEARRRFRTTEVYFDTPVLIHALGYSGKTRQAPSLELIELLYELGARLRCFRHTRDEIAGILDACAYQLSLGGLRAAFGPITPTVEYFLSSGYTASDVEMLAATLDRSLEAIRVKVVDKPPYDIPHVIDEPALRAALESKMPNQKPQALDRDVDSISAIFRLRQGRQYYIVEESRAIFVTGNITLSRTAAGFFYAEAPSTAIAPCITEFTLTNMAWLKSPMRAPDLPRKRLIADFFAASQPSDSLLRRYVIEIKKLSSQGGITEQDVFLLRYSLQAKSLLMQATQGAEALFTIGTVPEILNQVREAITAEAEERLAEAEAAVAALRGQEQARAIRIKLLSQRIASTAANTVGILLLVLLALSLTAPTYLAQPAITPMLSLAGFLLAAFLLVFSVANYYVGTTIRGLVLRLGVALQPRIEAFLLRIAG